jgi:hypothetical protein
LDKFRHFKLNQILNKSEYNILFSESTNSFRKRKVLGKSIPIFENQFNFNFINNYLFNVSIKDLKKKKKKSLIDDDDIMDDYTDITGEIEENLDFENIYNSFRDVEELNTLERFKFRFKYFNRFKSERALLSSTEDSYSSKNYFDSFDYNDEDYGDLEDLEEPSDEEESIFPYFEKNNYFYTNKNNKINIKSLNYLNYVNSFDFGILSKNVYLYKNYKKNDKYNLYFFLNNFGGSYPTYFNGNVNYLKNLGKDDNDYNESDVFESFILLTSNDSSTVDDDDDEVMLYSDSIDDFIPTNKKKKKSS